MQFPTRFFEFDSRLSSTHLRYTYSAARCHQDCNFERRELLSLRPIPAFVRIVPALDLVRAFDDWYPSSDCTPGMSERLHSVLGKERQLGRRSDGQIDVMSCVYMKGRRGLAAGIVTVVRTVAEFVSARTAKMFPLSHV